MTLDFWKPIRGYKGFYEVSNAGDVRSLSRSVSRGKHKLRVSGRDMKLSPDKKGYLYVKLCKNGRRKRKGVHGLVLSTFVGCKPKGHEVCHIDGSTSNNRASNLRWGTPSSNNLDKRAHGTNRGLPVVRDDGVMFDSIKQAGEALGIHYQNIWKVCVGKRKTCGGHSWSYVVKS